MNLFELYPEELETFFFELGEPKYRAKQLFVRMHKSLSKITELYELPKKIRDYIIENQLIPEIRMIGQEMVSDENQKDYGTQKFVFDYNHQKSSLSRIFEAVWIVSDKRRTACISSQSGCSLNCKFCATAKLSFKGNLSSWQILQQVYQMIVYRKKNREEKLTNVVFMGMGEPFYNYDNVIRSAKILNHPMGLHIGSRHITISTAGVVSGIERFIREHQPFNLAVSLNSPFEEERNELMDITKKFSLSELFKVCKEYIKHFRKNITFEYILIPDVNMSEKHIKELIKIAKILKHCKFNLIPLHTNFNNWRAPTEFEVLSFQKKLREHGILAFYRGSPGKTINAACGMLALQKVNSEII